MKRREFLGRLGMAGGAALALPELARVLAFQRQPAAQPAQPDITGEPVLSPAEAATLAAACARIIPTDAQGPGAAEARAWVYIDRSLGGWLRPSRDAYAAGLASIDAAAMAQAGRRFADLAPPDQDKVLASLDSTPFFAMLRTHTIQGTFCDPAYGGNAGFVGWDLIGYPGVRLNVTATDQRMSGYAAPVRRSAYDYAMFASTMGAGHAP